MARSIKKGPFVDGHLMKKVEQAQEAGCMEIATMAQDDH